MLSDQEKAYCRALLALKKKDYKTAVSCFESVDSALGTNSEFGLLHQTTRLLIAVKDELNNSADSNVKEITEEIVING